MTAEDSEPFEPGLRGESRDPVLAHRLGELLRAQHGQAEQSGDEVARQRVWQQISSEIDLSARARTQGLRGNGSHRRWPGKVAFAQAAAFAILGIALGYFIRTPGTHAPAGRLEFSYGDLELSRGELTETRVLVDDPVEAMRPITGALIRDQLPFEIHSVSNSNDRRLLVTLPAILPPASAAAFQRLGITPAAGQTQAITFAARSESGR